jgi:signal peptidase II
MTRRWTNFGLIALAAIVLDQLTKLWARSALPTDPRGFGVPVPVIEGYFDWRLSYNTGSAFGLFADMSGARIFLTVVAVVAIGAIGWMVKQARDDQKLQLWALALLAGGAVGNLIDRIAHGRVTDFIVWKYHAHEWPVFNVADMALCVGVGLLLLDMIREGARERAAARAGGGEAATRGSRAGKRSPPSR